jgi:plastocyanin
MNLRLLPFFLVCLLCLGAGCGSSAVVQDDREAASSTDVTVSEGSFVSSTETVVATSTTLTMKATSTVPAKIQPVPVKPKTTTTVKQNPSRVTVEIKDTVFSPQVITVLPGGTVTWVNKGQTNHTSTGIKKVLMWDSGTLLPGQSFSRVFPTTGTYVYYSSASPLMEGTVIVGSVISQ